jgi:CRP-like cAMP-binding protein
MLARGSVTLVEGVGAHSEKGRRIVSFKSGVVFGETAMLDGGPRTATAIADSDSIAYTLSRTELDRLRAEAPTLAAQLLFNLARQLSGRLRFATMVLWADAEERG